MRMQSIIRAIYPSQCVACDTPTVDDFGLCGPCWSQTDFIGGMICDQCNAPMSGGDADEIMQCDDCLRIARPWSKGRAVFRYHGVGRKLALAFKHSDRTDLTRPISQWMAQRARPLLTQNSVIVPVPLHWVRLMRRRYNQSALLATGIARELDCPVIADALLRPKPTRPLKGANRTQRFETLIDAIALNPRRQAQLLDQSVLLVDDVMTSGATMAAAAEACFQAGAARVDMVVLARSVKDA